MHMDLDTLDTMQVSK